MDWTDDESRDYLNWSLEGKALDCFTLSTQMGTEYLFRQVMRKLEGRFGAKELAETSKGKFHQAQQKQDETLDDWADRVLTLATPAFRDLPEKHCRTEAIAKFCQGCLDKDAGKHVCLEQPGSMEVALDRVKHFQCISRAVDGKKKRASEENVVVNVVSTSPPPTL